MSYAPPQTMKYYDGEIAARAEVGERADFITRTYSHLAGAIAAFVLLEVMLYQTGMMASIASALMGSWIFVLIGFMAVGMIADKMAHSNTTPMVAYGGLGLFVVGEGIIFCPLLYIAAEAFPGIIFNAALTTVAVFTALTVTVLVTRKDFSFLGSAVKFGMFAAVGLIVVSFFTPITLGFWFAAGMVALVGMMILYQTSNILLHYRTDQYVAASLGLFASIATMFWYILMLFMSRD